MPNPITNFKDSNGVDLGNKLITKEYLMTVYPQIAAQLIAPELWNWGDNTNGKLGVNDTTRRTTLVTTLAGGSNWKSIGSASGQMHYGIKTDGTLWLWGLNNRGQLGTNDTTTRSTPVTTLLGGTNWKQVSGWGEGTIAIKTDGTLWLWGDNYPGTIGSNGGPNPTITPVTTFAGGNNWKQCAAHGRTCAAVKTDGTLWVWGDNTNGRLGINNTASRNTPVTTFAGGTNWKQVSCGNQFTSAVKTDGTLWTWGNNASGQLGINNTATRTTPVTTFLGGTNWKQVSCGDEHIAAIKIDGTLWTWGRNYQGALGINNTTNKSTPVTTFAGGTNWKQVGVGRDTNAAIKTDGSLWVWGLNTNSELGAGAGNKYTPVTTLIGGNNWKSASGSRSANAAIIAIQSADYI